MGKKMGRMKGMFKKAGRRRTESLESGPGEVPRSPSADTMPDGSVADDSDTSSTYDEVCTLVLVTPCLVPFQDPLVPSQDPLVPFQDPLVPFQDPQWDP